MLHVQATVTQRDELEAGRLLLGLHAPDVARRVRPGHLLAWRAGSSELDPLLRAAVPVAGAETSRGIVLVLFARSDTAPAQVAGQRIDLLGPIGRPWQTGDGARNLLLVGLEEHLGALLFLTLEAAKRSANVTLLVGAPPDRPALRGNLIPPAVEYQFARGTDPAAAALDLLDSTLLSWADKLYTTLPLDNYPALADRIRAHRFRWPSGFANGFLAPPMACFSGICDSCLLPPARRFWRACVDGPTCDVRDFVKV